MRQLRNDEKSPPPAELLRLDYVTMNMVPKVQDIVPRCIEESSDSLGRAARINLAFDHGTHVTAHMQSPRYRVNLSTKNRLNSQKF